MANIAKRASLKLKAVRYAEDPKEVSSKIGTFVALTIQYSSVMIVMNQSVGTKLLSTKDAMFSTKSRKMDSSCFIKGNVTEKISMLFLRR